MDNGRTIVFSNLMYDLLLTKSCVTSSDEMYSVIVNKLINDNINYRVRVNEGRYYIYLVR